MKPMNKPLILISILALTACGGDDASPSDTQSSLEETSSSAPVVASSSQISTPSSAANQSSSAANPVRVLAPEGFGASVTGGAGGATVTATTGTQINQALCGRASMDDPITIYVDGVINHGNTSGVGCNTADDKIEIKGMRNVSIIGVGSNALFDEIGIHMRDAQNVIIQNVHIRNVKKSGTPTSNGGDSIGMESDVHFVWIDHNTLEASGGEKDGYDSLLDMKANVTDVTVSYNVFRDSSRGGLIGSSDSDDQNTRITFHHNWYKNIQQRTPLLRHGLIHTYNNYWENDDINYMIHGINARMGGRALVEGNYFYNTNNILLASDDSDEPGCWQTNNDNTILPRVQYSRTVGNGALVIPEVIGGQLQSTCSVSVPYSYNLEASANIPEVVMANAGHGIISGGTAPSNPNPPSVSSSSTPSSAGASSSMPVSGEPSGQNLSLNAGADGSSKASGYSYGSVVDGQQDTYWSPSGTSNERISVKFSSAVTVATVVIREPTNTVTQWSLINNDNGDVLASGSQIGNELSVAVGPVALQKINLIIHSASASPMISEIELYN